MSTDPRGRAEEEDLIAGVSEVLRAAGLRLPPGRPPAAVRGPSVGSAAGRSPIGAARVASGVSGVAVGRIASSRAALAGRLDHTLVAPDATRERIRALCGEAVDLGCHAVCVNPTWVGEAVAAIAADSGARRSTAGVSGVAASALPVVCSVVGFPLGAHTPEGKAAEAAVALASGATEVDLVLQIGWLAGALPRAGGGIDAELLARLQQEIELVAAAVRLAPAGPPPETRRLKVILETGLLDARQKVAGALLAAGAGADFIKTSTGFSSGGATLQDVRLLRAALGPAARGAWIKASGGIRDASTALAMLEAGADRLGTSSAAAILHAVSSAEHRSVS